MRSSGRRRWVSPVLRGLTRAINAALAHVARGSVLDAGACTSPYRRHLLTMVSSIDSIDLKQRGEALTFVGGIQDMAAVLSTNYDTVICSEGLNMSRSRRRLFAKWRECCDHPGISYSPSHS